MGYFGVYWKKMYLGEIAMNDKLRSLIDGTKGVVGEIITEDVVPAIGVEMLKGTVLEAASDTFSIISPRIGGAMLAYKQKRWEHNWERYIKKIIDSQDEINRRLGNLEEAQVKEVKEKYFPIISDYVSDEKQKEKIDLIVNGFINLSSGINLQEDTVIMYYDTLEQLSLLDIRVLKCYIQNIYIGDSSGETIVHIMADYEIDMAQVQLIKEKLTRLGLIESKNDADMDNNIREMAAYLESVQKGKKNQKLKLKRISKSESYKATSYGRKFTNFFTNICKENE